MSVKQRGNGWQVYVRSGDTRFRKTYSTKEEATVQEALVRQAVALGKPIPESSVSFAGVTLREAANKCYEMHWRGTKSEGNTIQYIKQLEEWFGKHLVVSEINTQLIDDFILSEKQRGSANATINRKLAALSKILRHQLELGKVQAMPVIHRQKEGKNRIRWLTKEEERVIIDTMLQWGLTDLLDAFVVSIDTGIRKGELLKIRSTDISSEGLYLGDTKNGDPRLVPLTKRAREVLERRQGVHSTRLFPFTYDWDRSIWDRVRNHLELDDVVWHTLRHTTCSRLVQGGLPLTHVKEWMGHRAIQTTMRYAHLAPKHLRQGVSLLEE